ncbi:uncharacterized protein KD926_004694 [Aspergillus affinis]|uniref:uncharacterized protein n=1 Tax=Aspergillus affinis TaxID=1070780 RepID=UPI0022FE28B1|nr:uncharacterized protein KD926_004694 [Aspergillus affinis]KAI9035039.1 hypothetical protein KD926_004694 [Aspergillus affinis]
MAPAPAHPAQTDEHQYWTDPILCEETLARLEHFRNLGWLPPNFRPKTVLDIAVIEHYWRKFCIQSNEDYVDYLLLEDQTIYMNFFDWMSKTSREKLLQSYDKNWRRLCQYFELFTRRRVSEDAHKQMRRFLAGVFPAGRRTLRRTKDKHTLDVDVYGVMYWHHWVHSRFFRHGSMIVQFATVQLRSAITGTQPSVLLPQDTSSPGIPALGKRKRDGTFQSDLPKHISLKDLPDSFRDLKGRPEGADGNKFFNFVVIS